MNFVEVIQQALLFTASFFIFNIIFNKFVFKNRASVQPSLGKVIGIFTCFCLYSMTLHYFADRNNNTESNQATEISSGQSFSAPEASKIHKPLNCDFNFISQETENPEKYTISTPLARYTFSSRGAILESMDLLWQNQKITVPVLPNCAQCFLIGVLDKAPMMYELVQDETIESDRMFVIKYRAKYDLGIINKIFTIYKNNYQIDLSVHIQKYGSATEQIRLLFGMPAQIEELVGIVNTPSQSNKVSLQNIYLEKDQTFKHFWFEPKMFGFSQKFLTLVCCDASRNALMRAYFKQNQEKDYQAILESAPFDHSTEYTWSFYMGPKTAQAIIAVAPDLADVVHYGWLNFIAKPLFKLLIYLHQYCQNYGIAIILLSFILQLLLLPFTINREKTMRQQAEFAKKQAYLKQKYKHDKEALDQANAELMQKQGMSLFLGCLPMFIPIPIFIALNKVLSNSIELHGASFLWMPDLSMADPYYILSILMCLGMIFAPNNAQQEVRQWASRIGMALIVGAVTACIASGAVIFIVMNSWFSIAQSYFIHRISWLSRRFA